MSNNMRAGSEEEARRTARTLADAALYFITDGGTDDDGGSDEFHAICGIQHRFTTREDPSDDPLVRMALALTIGMLGNRLGDDAVATRFCLQKLAAVIGLTTEAMLYSAAQSAEEGACMGALSEVLLDHEDAA